MRIHVSHKTIANNGILEMVDLISPDSIELLRSMLINLTAGQTVSISGRDFRKLSGDDINALCSEGD